jgi:hypothetical protein
MTRWIKLAKTVCKPPKRTQNFPLGHLVLFPSLTKYVGLLRMEIEQDALEGSSGFF